MLENVRPDVVIEPNFEMEMMEALVTIGKSVKMKKGQLNAFISFGEETAKVNDQGGLTIITSIDGHKVEMDVPKGLWQWNISRDGAVS